MSDKEILKHFNEKILNLMQDKMVMVSRSEDDNPSVRYVHSRVRQGMSELIEGMRQLKEDEEILWDAIVCEKNIDDQLLRMECVEGSAIELVEIALEIASRVRNSRKEIEKEKASASAN